jgi:predicted NBD/HSP70 family sugar kinase
MADEDARWLAGAVGASSGADARRRRNRERLIAALREAGSASRAELARHTGLSRTTVASLVSELQRDGLLEERDGRASPAGGRPPVLLSFTRSAGVALGIDFGKRHLRVAVADLGHSILAEAERPMATEEPAETALAAAVELVGQVLGESGAGRGDVVGVGMGLPGPIDRRSGRVGSSSILPGWVGVAAADELRARLGPPLVRVDNDANLGALAELHWGAAAGARNAAYLKVSTGIGAGLVVEGRLFGGSTGMAGEIGHAIVQDQGQVCRCGKRGCLETVAAAPALIELLRPRHGELTTPQLLDLAAAGDAAARRVIADAGRHIGVAAATLCDLLNPELIVVGGELSAAGDVLLDPLREQVHRDAIPATARAVEVVPGVLGPRAELLGALALVLTDGGVSR